MSDGFKSGVPPAGVTSGTGATQAKIKTKKRLLKAKLTWTPKQIESLQQKFVKLGLISAKDAKKLQMGVFDKKTEAAFNKYWSARYANQEVLATMSDKEVLDMIGIKGARIVNTKKGKMISYPVEGKYVYMPKVDFVKSIRQRETATMPELSKEITEWEMGETAAAGGSSGGGRGGGGRGGGSSGGGIDINELLDAATRVYQQLTGYYPSTDLPIQEIAAMLGRGASLREIRGEVEASPEYQKRYKFKPLEMENDEYDRIVSGANELALKFFNKPATDQQIQSAVLGKKDGWIIPEWTKPPTSQWAPLSTMPEAEKYRTGG